jgi:hypothetical protein
VGTVSVENGLLMNFKGHFKSEERIQK